MPDHDDHEPTAEDGVLATTHTDAGAGTVAEYQDASHDEPVLAPDQLKPFNRKLARIGALGGAVALIAFLSDNRQYHVGQYACVLIVLIIVAVVGADWWARKNGLSRRD